MQWLSAPNDDDLIPPKDICPDGTSVHISDLDRECRRPDGTPHGPVIRYWRGLEGESAWIVGSHLDGEPHGPWYTYTLTYGMDGPRPQPARPLLTSVVEYSHGKKHGRAIRYGPYREEERYFQGQRHGVWRSYEKGQLMRVRTFRHGLRHGPSIRYNGDNEPETAVYCDGKLQDA